MKKFFFLFSFLLLFASQATAQCDIALNEIDEFDSTRVVSAPLVSFGYMIPSEYETEEGSRLVEEAKMLFSFSEGDSISAFFMTLAIPEFKLQPIETGFNVFMKLSDGEVVRLYNVPDKGFFDKRINMRVYQHTCVIPFELYYRLTDVMIEKVRINYPNQKRTIIVSKRQQEAIRDAIRCVGRWTGYYPRP